MWPTYLSGDGVVLQHSQDEDGGFRQVTELVQEVCSEHNHGRCLFEVSEVCDSISASDKRDDVVLL